jgi:hypothetical protein
MRKGGAFPVQGFGPIAKQRLIPRSKSEKSYWAKSTEARACAFTGKKDVVRYEIALSKGKELYLHISIHSTFADLSLPPSFLPSFLPSLLSSPYSRLPISGVDFPFLSPPL